MAFETINLGTQPAGTGGDTARSAFEKTNRNFLAAEVLSAAMSQAQFEAIRAQNKERYAASGWVSFGNHESGKQVNECKPGLYTALTTPNTLLIGKAGGVGGSKTDHASVHIDGVVFNLTNQFVLTLPSHPTSTQPERMDMYGLESEKVEISAASPNAYQGGLRGVGAAVNLFTATDQQKKDFFSANANTTYIGTDGKIYQWQLYKVSFAGTTDGVPSPSEQGYSLNAFGDLWLKAGKNLLYFGNVLRLNDGGYHPSFNPLGAAKFVGDTFWYNTAASITSRADCFEPSKLLTGSGSISSGKSGRPETGGRYYDAIYADGYGGVCRDMRYSAFTISLDECCDALFNSKIGKYRGYENPVFTTFCIQGGDSYNPTSSVDILKSSTSYIPKISDIIYAFDAITQSYVKGVVKSVNQSSDGLYWYLDIGKSISRIKDSYLVAEQKMPYLVGGNALKIELIGNPENINISKISTGFNGQWIGITDGVIVDRDSKKTNLTYFEKLVNQNSSSSWFIGTRNYNYTAKKFTDGAVSQNDTIMYSYNASSNQTDESISVPIKYGSQNLINLLASSDYAVENGALLGESLIGKVLKNNSGVSVNNKSLSSCAIDGTGKLTSATNFDGVTHQALTLGAPANNSPAFKAVSYLANINQQAFIQYAYTELKHNGSSWGDDGKVTIVDNQSTKTDLNGNTVLVGTAKLKEPIGWIKNKV